MIGGGAVSAEDQGLRGPRLAGLLALLCLGAFADLALSLATGSALGWLVPVISVTVSVLTIRGLTAGGRALFVSAGAGAVLSLAATAVLAIMNRSGGALSTFGIAEGTALTFLAVGCWRRATGQARWVVAVAVALSIPLLPLRLGVTGDLTLLVTAALLVTTVAVAVGGALRAADAQRRVAVSSVRRAEREEVARELHDVVAHHVTGMVVLTQAARTVAGRPSEVLVPVGGAAPSGAPAPSLDEALAAVERAGAEALTSLRSMVTVLRSTDADGPDGAPLEPTPTVADLDDVVRRFRESGAVHRVDVQIAPDALALGPQVQAALHRVVQESLTNAARYARGARNVRVNLTCTAGSAVLTVVNSGGRAGGPSDVGDQAAWSGGFGIVGMRERVAALGGTLTAGPSGELDGPTADGGGWTVRAQVPA